MRRLLITLLILMLPLCTNAQGSSGAAYFIHVQGLFDDGEYELALKGFTHCLEKHRADIPVAKCEQYIVECNSRIEKNKQAKIEARRAKERAAAAERAAIEERKAARLKNKLVYIKTDVWTLDSPYPQYSSDIIGHLEDVGYHFADNQEDALWSVYITAATSKRAPDQLDPKHRVEVVAFYKIVYEPDLTIPPGGEGRCSEWLGSKTSYSEATYLTYEELCTPLCEAIKKVIK